MRARRTEPVKHRGVGGGWLPEWVWGLGFVVLVVAVLAFAFNGGRLPISGGHELRAVFADTNGIEANSPVRIAGVKVGTVTSVESMEAEDGHPVGLVEISIDDVGLPIRADAQLQVRPRLFLEGNYFIDLKPGSPGAEELESGALVPMAQTSSSVALDEVVTTLNSDVRADLRTVLDELSRGLLSGGGAAGLRELYATAPGAFRSTSIVARAALGTEPGDLAGLIDNLGSVTRTLAVRRTDLAALIGDLRTVTGALAAQRVALERSVATLPATIDAGEPALAALNGALPETRAFAREALSGVRALPETIDATTPLLRQIRALVSRREARGLLADLRPAVPRLSALTERLVPLLGTSRALGSCFNEIVIPWANETVVDPETPPEGRLFEEIAYGLVGISGESRSGDGNGPYARVLGGSGTNIVSFPPTEDSDALFGITPLELLGARPSLQSSAKPPFRPDVPCETQEPPDLLSGPAAAPPSQTRTSGPAGELDITAELRAEVEAVNDELVEAQEEYADSGTSRAQGEVEDATSALDRLLAERLGWEALLDDGAGGSP